MVYSTLLIRNALATPDGIKRMSHVRDVHWPVKNGKILISKDYNAKVATYTNP